MTDKCSSAETERAYLSEIETRKQIASLLSEFFPGKQWYRDLAAKAIYDRIPGVAQGSGMSVELVAACIDPVAFDPISLDDKHPGWECRRERATEAAKKIVALAAQPPAAPVDQERLAELQNEAGMYKSLYENAIAQRSSADNAAALAERLIQTAVDYEAGRCSKRELAEARAAVEVAIRPQSERPQPSAGTDAAKALAKRLHHAAVTMQNDDLSEPQSEKRRRHIERYEALIDAVEYLSAEPQELSKPQVDAEDVWPNGCADANSCANHMACMHKRCRHEYRDISDDVKAALAVTRPQCGGGK
jgi:hypothetical protein